KLRPRIQRRSRFVEPERGQHPPQRSRIIARQFLIGDGEGPLSEETQYRAPARLLRGDRAQPVGDAGIVVELGERLRLLDALLGPEAEDLRPARLEGRNRLRQLVPAPQKNEAIEPCQKLSLLGRFGKIRLNMLEMHFDAECAVGGGAVLQQVLPELLL